MGSRDRITVTGIRATGYHGVYDHERRDGQDLEVDLDLALNLAPAAHSDDVADTVHYGELAEQVAGIIAGAPVNLIERLAARIADHVLATFPIVQGVRVTVHKPQAPIPVPFADVAVTLTRGEWA